LYVFYKITNGWSKIYPVRVEEDINYCKMDEIEHFLQLPRLGN